MIPLEKYNECSKKDEMFYSDNKIHKPVAVKALSGYILEIEYDDGKIINFDMKKLLDHPLFKPLKEKSLFEDVKLNGSSISWDNDIDICGDSLYQAFTQG